MKKIVWLSLLLAAMMYGSSCNHEGRNERKVSTFYSDESHNTGENCMNCHHSGGEGEGWFAAAGSLYKPDLSTKNPNATVYLYTGPNGTGDLKATLFGDAKGNFYTTEQIDFSGGLYPMVKSANDSIQYMSDAITIGACNSCHGITQDRMWNY